MINGWKQLSVKQYVKPIPNGRKFIQIEGRNARSYEIGNADKLGHVWEIELLIYKKGEGNKYKRIGTYYSSKKSAITKAKAYMRKHK